MQFLWLIPSLAVGLYFGLANGMWQLALMSLMSVVVALVIRFTKRPAADFELRITRHRVLVNSKPIRRPTWLWPKPWQVEYERQIRELIASASRTLLKTREDPLNFVAGFDLEISIIESGPHLFLVGPTGSGKSCWLRLLLTSISGAPELLLVDYKGGVTLGHFGETLTDLDAPETRKAFWESLTALLSDRERYLVHHGASEWRLTGLKPVLVVVDELAHVLRQDPGALAALSAVAARGRSLGVHLVLASQSVSGIPRELLVNLNLRVLLGGTDEVDAMQLGAKKKPTTVQGVGSGLLVGGPEFRFPFRPEPIQGLRS